MLPFTVQIKPGLPIAEQVVHAVKKAVLTGQLRPGAPFVSVRQLSQALRINPNTAHKIVGTLCHEGVLVTTPAVGTTVADAAPAANPAAKAAVLGPDLERLAVSARQLGLKLSDVEHALRTHWTRLGGNPRQT